MWYLVRAVPTTLILLGVGLVLIWLSWSYVGAVWLTALLTIIVFGVWGNLMYYFAQQLPGLGQISPTNWFLIRAIPTTISALAVGGAISWATWFYSQNAAATTILIVAAMAVWGVLMFFFISQLPE